MKSKSKRLMSVALTLCVALTLVVVLAACIPVAPDPYYPEPDTPTPTPAPSPAPSPVSQGEKGEPAETTPHDWIDLGIIKIPPTLSYEEVGLHGEWIITGEILESKADVWGDTWLYVGPLMGDYDPLVDGAESFMFDDGHEGIFTGTFDLDSMTWVREDGMLITLRHGGDTSIFTDNEELILKIVRSLRSHTGNSGDSMQNYIQELFEARTETIYMEGMEEVVWLYPHGDIISPETVGMASYVIYIDESYQVELHDHVLWVSTYWDTTWDEPMPSMEIRQFPNARADEMVNNIVVNTDLSEMEYLQTKQPTDEFPFHIIEQYYGTEWNSLVLTVYAKDNNRGGVFFIITQHSLEASEGHGARFRSFIGTLFTIY